MPQLRGLWVVGLVVASSGCGIDSGGSGSVEPLSDGGLDTFVDDSGGGDSIVPPDSDVDSSGPDTGTPDTTGFDTSVIDTGTPDTGTTDTGTTDTGPADTGPADTGPADTGPADTGTKDAADAPATGLLSCVSSLGPSSGTVVTLSTEGPLDWAHWGLGGAGNWDHKSGGTILLSRGTVTGTANWYNGYTISFGWTGGTPTATEGGKSEGIWFGTGTDGISFDAGADNVTTRTIKVWTAYTGTGTIAFALSDGSGSWSGPISGTPATGNVPVTFTCDYRAKAAGATLTVKVAHATGFATTLFAAAVK
jgi:hypothetical protein